MACVKRFQHNITTALCSLNMVKNVCKHMATIGLIIIFMLKLRGGVLV